MFHGSVRAPEDISLGHAKVTFTFDSWPDGRVAPSTHRIPVVPRNPLPEVKVSPGLERTWSTTAGHVNSVRFTRDNRMLIVELEKKTNGLRHNEFYAFDPATLQPKYKLLEIVPSSKFIHWSSYAALSSDGRLMGVRHNSLRIIGEGKKAREVNTCFVHMIDLTTGKELWCEEVSGYNIMGLAFTPDNRAVIASLTAIPDRTDGVPQRPDFRGEFRLLDAGTGRDQGKVAGGPYGWTYEPVQSHDGRFLALLDGVAQDRGFVYRLHLLDVEQKAIRFQRDGVQSAAFAPDGKRLAVATARGEITVCDLPGGKELARVTVDLGKGSFGRMAWTEDGKELLIGGWRGPLWKWQPGTAGEARRVDFLPQQPADRAGVQPTGGFTFNYPRGLVAVALSGKLPDRPTGRNLEDDYLELPPPEIAVFDYRTLERRATLTGHRGQLYGLAFSWDGRYIASGGSDGILRLWNVEEVLKQTVAAPPKQ